ncbi:uncharacterized protein TOT_030000506 [Theileria orientalis strain Shintoku]|uniref:DUF676 domain-containing protein n=1 Tax=Theileria orientalis strain Shintoku TaxID=869250 RepID=J4C8R4_THEOR|nr:uncharacterized protein TOT_030000506 [Theileria orientalis strain Shintoku]BAM41243.1 uncharacterized protein TOT_030000506 [Theileria orientalis strain Shintoku]|eukprot:XP_009691544.1 uncharacterized protein TOT_030000506 [Theileria orientalis strain Shintoku]
MEYVDKSSLCYHCKVHKTGRICFKDDTVPSPRESEDANANSFFKRLTEPIHAAFVKAMVMKTITGTAIEDFVDYFRNRKIDHKFDIVNKNKSEFEYSSIPEYIRRCDRCLCYFSSQVSCHCGGCQEDPESHYVIMMHGILASPLMMTDCCRVLIERYPRLFVYFPVCACGKTLHGTGVVLKFLIDELSTLFSKLPSRFKVSLVGHSFGGILMRYFFLNHFKTTMAERQRGRRGKSAERSITWKNLVCVATPHAGIYEDNREFRKLVSLIGSNTINELDNETVELLFLLKDEGFVGEFERFIIYGNISGDMMVAPRTSIILPYHLYSDKDLHRIQKLIQKSPGTPREISELDFLRGADSQSPLNSDEEAVASELMARFSEIVERKIANSRSLKYIQNLMLSPPDRQRSLDGAVGSKRKRCDPSGHGMFSRHDFAKFNDVISEIVRVADESLLRRLMADNSLFYFEVLLSITHRLPCTKFAVYIPRIHMPHRSIITLHAPVTHESYTEEVLTHITHTFSY